MINHRNGSGGVNGNPTYPSPEGLTPILDRNIEAFCERRKREAQERVAAARERFTGSMAIRLFASLLFGFRITANHGWIRRWGGSFVVLAMMVSVEAIFLSRFVLITQNRMAAGVAERADLDVQVSLLVEHEITKLASLVPDVALKLGITTDLAFQQA
jgi:uncharacterized membrane protein